MSTVSSSNSSTSALAAAATFTGTGEDVLAYGAVHVTCRTDAAGTLFMEYSSDNVNYDVSHEYSLTAGVFSSPSRAPPLRYYRCRVVNGDTAQTYMRLSSVFRPISGQPAAGTMVFGTSVDSTALEVNDDPGTLNSLLITNADSLTAVYVKVYDLGSAPNPASDVPTFQFLVSNDASPFSFNPPRGLAFANGCYIRAVSGEGDTDTTSPSSDMVQVLASYSES